MTCSRLDEATWNAVKAEHSCLEIAYYCPAKAGRK